MLSEGSGFQPAADIVPSSRRTRSRWLFFESPSRSNLLLEHDLFRKPGSTPDQVRGRLFRDHALAPFFGARTKLQPPIDCVCDGIPDAPEHGVLGQVCGFSTSKQLSQAF